MADRLSRPAQEAYPCDVESLLDEVLRGDQQAERAIRRIGPRRKRSVRHGKRPSSNEEDLATLALAAGSPAEAAALIYSRIGAEQATNLAVQLGGLEGAVGEENLDDDRDVDAVMLGQFAEMLESMGRKMRSRVRRAEMYARKREKQSHREESDERYMALLERLASLEQALVKPKVRVFERNRDGLITSFRDE